MRRWSFSFLLTVGLLTISSQAFSQLNANSLGLLPLPNNPPVGIGTQLYGAPQNSLEIHFDPSYSPVWEAIIRLSENDSTANTPNWAALGLLPYPDTASDTSLSSLARAGDLILHNNQSGDIIITNYTKPSTTEYFGTAIRLATTGDTLKRPVPGPGHHDLERITILGNGNVGIDLPPDTALSDLGLGNPMDQVQIGGGAVAPIGYTSPIPGLTIYGGNRFEGMTEPPGSALPLYPVDYRGIYFNHYENHTTGLTQRFTPIASCGIALADAQGGTLQMNCWPPDSAAPLFDTLGATTLCLTGTNGLEFWSDERQHGGIENYHMFNVWRPGFLGYGVTRNTYGLFYHYTPVYIGLDTANGTPNCDFTNLNGVYPDIGDSTTWMLVVNGPELAKEIFVLDSTWADYVFDPNYKLPPLDEVENFTKENHHLPDIPSAKQMAKTGVPVGRTEAAITKQLEEEMLYIEQLSKQNEELSQKLDSLEKEIEDLKNQKEK